jgi:NadR type nicotinamide-nucleotide adenylyltransferase
MEKKTKTKNIIPQTKYKIAITGPESTAKSALAKALAEYYNTRWVPEYSREYLSKISKEYTYDDILAIAKGQVNSEEKLLLKATKYLFCDTDMMVCKIWCEEKYGKCHPWIIEQLENPTYDLYLLCNTDIPWEPDPLRENPNDRDRLFELYHTELCERDYPFAIVEGIGGGRIDNAVRIVDNLTLHIPNSH